MKALSLIVLLGILPCCQKTGIANQTDASSLEQTQTPEDEAYAKEFVEKAKKSQGLLLPRIAPVIKDKQAAIAVAESILFNVYGEEQIKMQRPYRVCKAEQYWVLSGKLPEGMKGGVFEIALDEKDGKVIGLTHGK
jgi:hypothetical protein